MNFNAEEAVFSRDALFNELEFKWSKQIKVQGVIDEIQFDKDQNLSKCFEYDDRAPNASSARFFGTSRAMESPFLNDKAGQ